MPLHCIEAAPRAVLVIKGALREKRRTLRTLHLLRCPAHVVLDTSGPCGFVITVLVAVLGVFVSAVEHALALGTAFHRLGALFPAQVFGCAFHAAMPVCWTFRCERLPAPDTGFGEVLPVFFTGHGYPSALQLVSPRRRHSPSSNRW